VLGGVTQAGGVILAGSTIDIGGALVQTADSLLTANGTGDAALTVGGTVSQTSSTVTATAGGIQIGGDVTQTASLLGAASDISVTGGLAQNDATLTAGGQVSLAGPDAFSQSGGSSLSGAAGVFVTTAQGVTQQAGSAVSSANGPIELVATGGDIDFAGTLQAARVALIASDGSIDGGGTVLTGTLAASAAGSLSIDGQANQVAAIAPETLANGQTLAGLTAAGVLTLDDSISLALTGDASVFGGTSVAITAADLNQGAGTEIASYTLGDNGKPTDSGSVALDTDSTQGTISLGGTLASGEILIGATTAARHVTWDNNIIITGTSLPPGPAGRDVKAPIGFGTQRGVFVRTYGFTQTGLTDVDTLGAPEATVEIELAGGGGLVAFDPGRGTGSGLFAPKAVLLLDLKANGSATGNIDVAGLNVFYTGLLPPTSGSADLTGLVDGQSGFAAAGAGFTHSVPGSNYRINDCPIESISCVLLSPIVVPVTNPVEDVQQSVLRRQDDDDDDLILPNVAEQDY